MQLCLRLLFHGIVWKMHGVAKLCQSICWKLQKSCKARLENAQWHNTAQLGFEHVDFQMLVRWWLKLLTKNWCHGFADASALPLRMQRLVTSKVKTWKLPELGYAVHYGSDWYVQKCGLILGQRRLLPEKLVYIALCKCHGQGLWFQSKNRGVSKYGKVLTPCCKQLCRKLGSTSSWKAWRIPAAKNDPIRFGPVKSWKQHWRDTNDRYEKYTEAFHIPPGCVAVPDDKHKKHAWIVACAFYSLLLGTFAWTAASWEASLLSPTEADSWCRTTLLRVLGPRLFETLGFNGPYKILPSCYMTFKSKCWNFGFRTCQKQQHSCLRKIITYASWPKKFLWKSAHRALDTVIKVHGQTCDTWSLKDATTKLHDGLRMLNGTGHTECARCFRSKPPTAGVAADAGQFYEMIDSSVAVQRMASILQEFSRIEGSKLVVVKRTKNGKHGFQLPLGIFLPVLKLGVCKICFVCFAVQCLCVTLLLEIKFSNYLDYPLVASTVKLWLLLYWDTMKRCGAITLASVRVKVSSQKFGKMMCCTFGTLMTFCLFLLSIVVLVCSMPLNAYIVWALKLKLQGNIFLGWTV